MVMRFVSHTQGFPCCLIALQAIRGPWRVGRRVGGGGGPGPIGRGLGVLALVGSGVMMFFGRLNWPIFVAVFVGVVLIFSAETIIDGFAAP